MSGLGKNSLINLLKKGELFLFYKFLFMNIFKNSLYLEKNLEDCKVIIGILDICKLLMYFFYNIFLYDIFVRYIFNIYIYWIFF